MTDTPITTGLSEEEQEGIRKEAGELYPTDGPLMMYSVVIEQEIRREAHIKAATQERVKAKELIEKTIEFALRSKLESEARISELAKEVERLKNEVVPHDCKCGKHEKSDPHTCPYKSEINDDNQLCTCCSTCRQECCDEI